MLNRSRPTVADIRANKGKRQMTMVHIENSEEARACAAAGIDVLSIETPIWDDGMREAAGDTFVQVGLQYGRLQTTDDYLRGAHDAMQIGGDCCYCAASTQIVERLSAEGIPVVGHVGLIPARRTWTGGFKAVGKTLDTAKHAAALSGLPMVAVATSLAHDGIASPVSSLEEHGRKASFGVQMPIAVVVDLDYVRASDPTMRRSGIGDVVSNLSAIADWWLASEERGEPVDGLAVTFARTAATALLHREDGIDDDDFLIALAEALVLSGLAMATAGSSRPCSGGDHEILHAIDHLFPGTAHHGELAGVGSLFTSWLRGADNMARDIDACLTRHSLPRTPRDLGLSHDQFAAAVLDAPSTRPDRYTILEHLDLSEGEVGERVRAYSDAYDR